MAQQALSANKSKWVIIIAAVLAAALVIGACVVLLGTESPQTPIERMFQALKTDDFSLFTSCFHPDYAKEMNKNYPLLPDQQGFMKEMKDLFHKQYGAQYNYALQITSKDRYEGNDFNELRMVLEAEGIYFSDAYLITYYTLADENGARECLDASTVVKCGSKWFIVD